jgi:hypothetical protein
MAGTNISANAQAFRPENRRCRSCHGQINFKAAAPVGWFLADPSRARLSQACGAIHMART